MHDTPNITLKSFNSQLNKIKSEIKKGTQETLNLSSNVVGNSHDKTNFPHRLLLTDAQVSRLCKAFVNNLSARIKLSKFDYLRWYSWKDFLVAFLDHY